MQICTNCFSFKITKQNNYLVCDDCHHKESLTKYRTLISVSKDTVREGFQYRKRIEYDLKKNLHSKKTYFLKELNEVFSFLGLSVISGLVGNLAYDIIKQRLSKLTKDPLIIEIDDVELQRFLKSELQQKKFIKYIQDYRAKKIGNPKSSSKTDPAVKKRYKKTK